MQNRDGLEGLSLTVLSHIAFHWDCWGKSSYIAPGIIIKADWKPDYHVTVIAGDGKLDYTEKQNVIETAELYGDVCSSDHLANLKMNLLIDGPTQCLW